MPVGEKHTFRFGPFELDTQCRQLRKDGVGLKLQGQPIQVLEILLQKPGQLVTREEIRQRLWTSDTFVDFDHSLNTAVKKLRQTLGDEADTPRYIETLPKRGYRFIGEVEREAPKEETREAAVAVLPIGPLEPRSSDEMRRRKPVVIGSALALLVIACGVLLYSVLKPEPQPRIVGSHILTKTGTRKVWLEKPIVDRGYIYFQEEKPSTPNGAPSGSVTLRVAAGGGEVSATPVAKGNLTDISRNGSFLLDLTDDQVKDQRDVWTQSPSDQVPRLIIKDGSQAIWSGDGHQIFFVRGKSPQGQLYRANADGTEAERLAGVPNVWFPDLTPDGARIRFEGGTESSAFWEVGTDGSNLRSVFGSQMTKTSPVFGTGSFGGSWSPDGRHYFFTSWDGDRWSLFSRPEIHRWWRKGGSSPSQQLTFGPLWIGNPAISSDGKQLYAVGMEKHGELSVYDSKSRTFVPYLGGISVCDVDFSRDGQWMTYVSYPEGTLWRSRIDGTERVQLTTAPLDAFNPRWSPDGKLVTFMNPSGGRRIYVVSADGGAPLLLVAADAMDPAWSADGKSLAYTVQSSSEQDLRILDLATQKSMVVPGSQGMWSHRWSPDGKYLAALSYTAPSKLMLYTFARNTWEELASGIGFGWLNWSRDGKFVCAQDGDSLVCIAVSNHKKKTITSLQGFRSTAYIMDMWDQGWYGLAPDGRPITTRNAGLSDVYAFDLEYK
jgi:Tol biopolymer transport system component/DNA-binding winged helix-turn-helix (wHTH) protein